MRIESPNVNTPPPPAPPEGGSKVAGKPAVGVSEGGADALGGFSPTPDLTKLLALVQQVPDVRTDLVTEVTDRAAIGELASRTAALDTASAMLDAQ